MGVLGDDGGIRLIRGRPFGNDDRAESPRAAIINETMAEQFWPGQDAIGERFRFSGQQPLNEVVGIVGNTKVNLLGEPPTPFIYQPITQEGGAFFDPNGPTLTWAKTSASASARGFAELKPPTGRLPKRGQDVTPGKTERRCLEGGL